MATNLQTIRTIRVDSIESTTFSTHPQSPDQLYFLNLVPRSLVDEAEGEIWQSKKICFSWLAAPFDSCPIPSLKIDVVFRSKFSSNSNSKLEISAVGENEKPIRKDERRKHLGVICHSGLNNFCNKIVPYLNPKHAIQRALKLPSISHTCFFDKKLYKPLSLFALFVLRLRGHPISAWKQHVGSWYQKCFSEIWW